MRVFVAAFSHETSAFSPIPTTRKSFESFEFYRPAKGVPDDHCLTLVSYGEFIRRSQANGHDVYASTCTWAQPSARTSSAGYESIRDEILADLRTNGSFDIVLLFLHGAQMAHGYDDCEGDLLKRAREIAGPDVFIGALLDLHANVSQAMLDNASALVACRNYPHTDFDERAGHLFEIAEQAALGRVQPMMHFLPLRMVGMFYTTESRMAAANAAALELQNSPGVLSVSLIHSFVWSNTADCRSGVLTIADGSAGDFVDKSTEVGKLFFAARNETQSVRLSVDEVLARVESARSPSTSKPFVIADTCDNPGGGAGSDSTFILDAVLRGGLTGYAFALFWDPVAVQFARDAGVGATFDLRLGGKTGPQAGPPLDVTGTVLGVFENRWQHGIGLNQPMGNCVVLEVSGNIVVVVTTRGQVFSPTCFTDFGIDIGDYAALVVKSTQHFYDQFAPLASEILYCDTPGGLSLSMRVDQFDGLTRPIWPLDDIGSPFAMAR